MRFKLAVTGFVITALSVAACGSGGSSTTATSSSILTNPRAHVTGDRPIQIYRARLSGAAARPTGAPHGIGRAIVALHRGSTVCWRFAHLHGFTDATTARLQAGRVGESGNVVASLSPGPRLHHEGCVHVSPALSNAIQRNPSDYYVTIASKQYPAGAVRAQL